MEEEPTNLSSKTVLHIFPDSHESKLYVRKRHILEHFKLNNNSKNLNEKVRKVVKSCKKRLTCNLRKYPRTMREHTDFDTYHYEMTCPNCLSYIHTNIYYYNTNVTHAVAASLSPLCLCMVPYFTTKYKNVAHYCPRCKIYLGTKFGAGRYVFSCCIQPGEFKTAPD